MKKLIISLLFLGTCISWLTFLLPSPFQLYKEGVPSIQPHIPQNWINMRPLQKDVQTDWANCEALAKVKIENRLYAARRVPASKVEENWLIQALSFSSPRIESLELAYHTNFMNRYSDCPPSCVRN